jgi:D-sedoheptulose 7-phosphate isomerase
LPGTSREGAVGELGVSVRVPSEAHDTRLGRLLLERSEASERFFPAGAEHIARLCHGMAERFACGGRLLALGASPQARSDARHVAVEFVHPVIVGKRALPALALVRDGGPLPLQADLTGTPDDLAIAFGTDEGDAETAEALAILRGRGCLTIAFSGAGADWELEPPSSDPFVRQELVETLYHVLWELVHVFFEQRGLLAARHERTVHDAGPSSFLYPFLAEQERDLEAVVADVRSSVVAKAREVDELREATLSGGWTELVSAARSLREVLDSGGTLLVFGNGGSATDAMDAAADFRAAPGRWPHRRALDLTDDGAILTALANDIGPRAIFARQIIAYGRPGDAALALSTSGGSANVVEGLAEARRRGLMTIALVGYGGGQVESERLADHVVVAPSQHVPRIQEAQATVYHALRELVELEGAE